MKNNSSTILQIFIFLTHKYLGIFVYNLPSSVSAFTGDPMGRKITYVIYANVLNGSYEKNQY